MPRGAEPELYRLSSSHGGSGLGPGGDLFGTDNQSSEDRSSLSWTSGMGSPILVLTGGEKWVKEGRGGASVNHRQQEAKRVGFRKISSQNLSTDRSGSSGFSACSTCDPRGKARVGWLTCRLSSRTMRLPQPGSKRSSIQDRPMGSRRSPMTALTNWCSA